MAQINWSMTKKTVIQECNRVSLCCEKKTTKQEFNKNSEKGKLSTVSCQETIAMQMERLNKKLN